MSLNDNDRRYTRSDVLLPTYYSEAIHEGREAVVMQGADRLLKKLRSNLNLSKGSLSEDGRWCAFEALDYVFGDTEAARPLRIDDAAAQEAYEWFRRQASHGATRKLPAERRRAIKAACSKVLARAFEREAAVA